MYGLKTGILFYLMLDIRRFAVNRFSKCFYSHLSVRSSYDIINIIKLKIKSYKSDGIRHLI